MGLFLSVFDALLVLFLNEDIVTMLHMSKSRYELNGKNCISNLIGSGSFSHSAGMGKTGNSQSEGRDWSKEQNKSSSGKAGEVEDLQRNLITISCLIFKMYYIRGFIFL